ncbi:hypothetical protein [Pseudorhodobacter ferrugineus]|uniref:hypothetical protein n=1 Tax=Pseudorhodobacter ferrugineus TaxID=77008 RepID=UPI0012DC2449|nr:hypothetical protein [Pseudorhodobacter ferrugineus]
MTTQTDKPDWLVQWQAAHPPRPAPAHAPVQRKPAIRRTSAPKPRCVVIAPTAPATPAPNRTRFSFGFDEPAPWAWDNCKRREPVMDLSGFRT